MLYTARIEKKNIPVVTETEKKVAEDLRKINETIKTDVTYNGNKSLVTISERLVKFAKSDVDRVQDILAIAETELASAETLQTGGKVKMPNIPEYNEALALSKIKGDDMLPMWNRFLVQVYYWIPKRLYPSESIADYISKKKSVIESISGDLTKANKKLDEAQESRQKAEETFKEDPLEKARNAAENSVQSTKLSVDEKKKVLATSSTTLLSALPTKPKETEIAKVAIKNNVLSAMVNFLESPNEATKEKFEQSASAFREYNDTRNKAPKNLTQRASAAITYVTAYSQSDRPAILKNIEDCQKLYGNQIDTNKPNTPSPVNKSSTPEVVLSPVSVNPKVN